jgi:anthraniloyl-CoA monooxygenase
VTVAIIGGGPAGLYLALLLRRANAGRRVVVLERNAPDDTFGWGVVFSEATLDNLRAADPESYAELERHFARWDDIDVHFRGRTITSGGHGFVGIARTALLRVLRERACALGAELRFREEVPDDDALDALGLGDAEVIVGADGINSGVRRRHEAAFGPTVEQGLARFAWLGTAQRFDAFTFCIVENEHGVFQAHAYQFAPDRSTFIVECDEASWRAAGFDRLHADASLRLCERMFAPWLGGHALMSNARHLAGMGWTRFAQVKNERWSDGNVVLVGDAAHTAHFSIGSGTKLAMEDAITLARELSSGAPLPDALARYEEERKTEALKLQNAARNSREWFENVKRYVRLEPEQFAYSLLTRSQRVSHENLRLRDDRYLSGVERWFAGRALSALGAPLPAESVVPPMFTPFRLRDLELHNRICVAPMDMYSATDGTPNDFHLVHLGARALGGAALVFTEMTCVSPEGRITLGCTGMYAPEHAEAWMRIVRFVHERTRASICLQLGHSGRKGSTQLMWVANERPLPEGNWETIAPDAEPHADYVHAPRAMTREDMDAVREQFVHATRMAVDCGFDMLELHCAHGYLLSSFITPLGNRRTDEYGGSLENRLRYPLEVFRAMRAEWLAERPMSVRISATDWCEDGVDGGESVEIARAFHEAGADIIHVSTGQTTPRAKPVFGRMFQTPYSDRIRNEAGIPTIAVGNITEPDQVNGIITAGRADLVSLARPHLADPQWTMRAAAMLGWEGFEWPDQYRAARPQFERTVRGDPRR